MKRTFILLLIVIFTNSFQLFSQIEKKETGNLVLENVPDIPQQLIDKVFQYQSTRAASFNGWLPDDSGILISTRFGETSQIHLVEKPGSARKQLTFFPEPVSGVSVCPDVNSKTFLFSKDVGGGEFYQIYSFNLKTGEYKMLTDGKSRNTGGLWTSDGSKFAYSSTKRNGTDTDIYLMDFKTGKEELLIAEGGAWGVSDWSPDNTKVLAAKYISANESHIYIFDLTTKKLEEINPSAEKIAYGGALWSKDGKGIYFISDEGSEFQQLKYYNLADKKINVLTKKIKWDVESITISEKGDKLAFTANEDGISKLYLMDTKTFQYSPVKNIPLGSVYSLEFNKDGDKLGFTVNSSKTPGDIYSINLKDYSLERWTYSEVGGLNTDNFVEPELIHYPTFDMIDNSPRLIPAFIYKPTNKKEPAPVLINIHGGPEGQFQPGFSSSTQYLVNEMGIAVIGPNVRGSTGYGKTYVALDNWLKREESVQDIGALLNWIKTQPDLDANRVCVFGGSYGGYMVLASMFHYNDKLKCGIDIVGISNFNTFLNNTQSYRRDLRRVEYGDERIPEIKEFLEKTAPLNNADKISKPMFVIQGLNDPRVPVTEAEQMVAKMRENKSQVWYMLAKDEGHGFQKKTNRDFMTYAVYLFLQENLLK